MDDPGPLPKRARRHRPRLLGQGRWNIDVRSAELTVELTKGSILSTDQNYVLQLVGSNQRIFWEDDAIVSFRL
jgi:hypothetical protein